MPQYIDVEYLIRNHNMGKQRAYEILHMLEAEKVNGKLCVSQRVWCEYLDSLMQSIGYLGGVPLLDWLHPDKAPDYFVCNHQYRTLCAVFLLRIKDKRQKKTSAEK